MSSAKSPTEILHEAFSLHKQGKLEEAEVLYREVLEAAPKDASALHLMGLLAAQRERPGEAYDLLAQSLAANPQSAVCYNDIGLVLTGLERFGNAEAAFRRALELQPVFPEAYLTWGNLYRDYGLLDRSNACYSQALAQRPGYAEAIANIQSLKEIREEVLAFASAMKAALQHPQPGEASDSTSPMLSRRELLPLVLNELGLKGTGAEIGVKEGKFSERVLRIWEGRALYSIDPWREFSTAEYADISNVKQDEQDEYYRQTIRRLMRFQRRSIIWRLTSQEASELLANDSLDFVYIDADHSYRGASEDIRLWYPKVKSGGVLAGHDYCPDGKYWFGDFGVQQAVNEFVAATNSSLFLCEEPDIFLSWVVVKP